jgi:hypothetical protein
MEHLRNSCSHMRQNTASARSRIEMLTAPCYAADPSIPWRLFRNSKCLRDNPKASEAIKDCLLYEGVNLLLASCCERGGGLWGGWGVLVN